MRVLDLFCGGGGASAGMKQAGASWITGVDIENQPEYPFWFFHADVERLPIDWIQRFDIAWASPPCQKYSYAGHRWRNAGREYPDLVGITRDKLLKSGIPFVIENVPGAPVRKDLILCGEMFGLKVIRHRIFEIEGFECAQPEHIDHRGTCLDGSYVTVAGTGGNDSEHNYVSLSELPGMNQLQTWQYAMGINWISNKKTLREAVPPAYSEYIFREFRNRKNDYPGSDRRTNKGMLSEDAFAGEQINSLCGR